MKRIFFLLAILFSFSTYSFAQTDGILTPSGSGGLNYDIIERSEGGNVTLRGNQILDGGTQIGYYEANVVTLGSEKRKAIGIFLPNDIKIAEAYIHGTKKDMEIEIIPYRDKMPGKLSLKSASESEIAQKVAEYLVQHDYL